jgi:glycosyltransferase involved in cell wall biosynthesis
MSRSSLSIFVSHPSSFLTDCNPHGDGLAAYEFIRRLAGRGHDLHVAVQSVELEGDVPANVTLYPIEKHTPSDSFKHVEYAVRVWQCYRRVARRHEIDVIHQLNPVRPGLSALLSFCSPPLVLGLYVPSWPTAPTDESEQGPLRRVATALMEGGDRIQQRRAAALLLSTPAARSRLKVPNGAAKTHVIPYGVDTDTFTPSTETGEAPDENPRVLFLGRLHRQKGIFVLLDAMEQVFEEHPRCTLVVAGSGEEEEKVQARVEAHPYGDNIRLLGHVEREHVPAVLASCSVLCIPSLGEPFGLGALEGMAAGKPIVGTDAGGLAYIIPDEGGCRVPPRNDRALADALGTLLSSPQRRREMGRVNRRVAEGEYDWGEIVSRLEETYYEIIDGSTAKVSD